MKKKIYLLSGLIVTLILFFTLSSMTFNKEVSGDFKYVGVSKCSPCHKGDSKGKQYEIWKDSKHAQAFKTLTTEAANKIAKDKGFTTPTAETPACVKCHVLGKDLNPAELEDTFDKNDGVQCETCHGPGSGYKSKMKPKATAIENGLLVAADKEAFCKGCHNSESPTFTAFNYEEMWGKIKHAKP